MSTKWKEGAEKMKKWYEGRALPTGPVMMNDYSTITDVVKYVETNLNIIDHYKDKPDAKPFEPAYYRLYHLKKYIEAHGQTGTADSKPGNV